MKYLTIAAYAACIPAANWLISNVGTTCVENGPCLIPVGFGLMAPSGVLMIGLALVLRDAVHELAGAAWAIAAILIGAVLSLVTSAPQLAVASAVAILASELSDFAVYAPIRRRNRALAVALSGTVGAVVDSVLFVWLAFGSIEFAAGTIIAKTYASLAVGAFLWWRK